MSVLVKVENKHVQMFRSPLQKHRKKEKDMIRRV